MQALRGEATADSADVNANVNDGYTSGPAVMLLPSCKHCGPLKAYALMHDADCCEACHRARLRLANRTKSQYGWIEAAEAAVASQRLKQKDADAQ